MNKLKVFVGKLPTDNKMDFVIEGFDITMLLSNDSIFDYVYDIDQAHIVAINFNINLNLQPLYNIANNLLLCIDMHHMYHNGDPGSDDQANHANLINQYNTSHKNVPPIISFTLYKNCTHTGMYFTELAVRITQNMFKHQPKQIFKTAEEQHPADLIKSHWYPKQFDPDTYVLDNIYEAVIGTEVVSHKEQLTKSYLASSKVRYPSGYHTELKSHNDQYSREPDNFRTQEFRDFYRTDLNSVLRNYSGFLGDPVAGHPLLGQDVTKHNNFERQLTWNRVASMNPIHNHYYKYSTLSIYLESTVNTYTSNLSPTSSMLTEKTWFPLVKGHFILPFGRAGMIELMRDEYKIEFPDWIDYSYSDITNDLMRWSNYILEVKRLLNLGSQNLHILKQKSVEMLVNNREKVLDLYNYPPEESIRDFCVQWKDRHQGLNKVLDTLTTM